MFELLSEPDRSYFNWLYLLCINENCVWRVVLSFSACVFQCAQTHDFSNEKLYASVCVCFCDRYASTVFFKTVDLRLLFLPNRQFSCDRVCDAFINEKICLCFFLFK